MKTRYKHYLFAFAIQIVLSGLLIHDWDGFVFITSAKEFLLGVTPYQTALEAPAYTFGAWMQQWYAYPPLPLLLFTSTLAPYFYLPANSFILERICIKLGFILGNLLCAYLVYKLVATIKSPKEAELAEKAMLYNPFLIFIAAVWGMFDIWIMNFILLGLLRLRQEKLNRTGVCIGLCLLVKPILAIVTPLFLIHVWNKTRSISKTAIFVFSAVVTFVAISLPFYLMCPEGFINQVAGMHADRPPFGWTPMQLLYAGQTLRAQSPFPIPSLAPSTISLISFALLGTVIAIILLYNWFMKQCSEKQLMASMFLTIVAYTIFNKGMNPQHFIIPVVMAFILIHTYTDYGIFKTRDLRRYYKFLVIPCFVAGLLEGRNYLMLIPPDIATRLTGKSAVQLDQQLAANFPISADFYYSISAIGTILLVVPAMVMAIIILNRSFRVIGPVVFENISCYLKKTFPLRGKQVIVARNTAFVVALIITLSTVSALVLHGNNEEESVTHYLPPQQDKLVGVVYRSDWNNPSHNPELPYDEWLEAEITPEGGYYTSTSAHMEKDIQQMKTANIDFVLVSFCNRSFYDIEKYEAVADICEQKGLRFAPLIEPGEFMASAIHPKVFDTTNSQDLGMRLTSNTKKVVIDTLSRALDHKDSPVFLLYDEDPVVFIKDIYGFAPGWSDNEKDYLAECLIRLYGEQHSLNDEQLILQEIAMDWEVPLEYPADLLQYYPDGITQFIEPANTVQRYWQTTFVWAVTNLWSETIAAIEAENGEVFWIVQDEALSTNLATLENISGSDPYAFNARFVLSPSSLSTIPSNDGQIDSPTVPQSLLNNWLAQTAAQCQYDQENDNLSIMSVTPGSKTSAQNKDDEKFSIPLMVGEDYTYDLFWQIAIQNNVDIVLIASWNEYSESLCIEPTVEYGDTFLFKTKEWADLLHASSAQMDDADPITSEAEQSPLTNFAPQDEQLDEIPDQSQPISDDELSSH